MLSNPTPTELARAAELPMTQTCTICRTELYSPWFFSVPCCLDCDLDEHQAEGERLAELKAEGDR